MRIEAIEKFKAADDDGEPVSLSPGDIRTVGENLGRLACSSGWARDIDDVVPTGKRHPGPVVVEMPPTESVINEWGVVTPTTDGLCLNEDVRYFAAMTRYKALHEADKHHRAEQRRKAAKPRGGNKLPSQAELLAEFERVMDIKGSEREANSVLYARYPEATPKAIRDKLRRARANAQKKGT